VSSSLNQTVLTGVLWQASLRWLSQVLAWTATIVIARKLSAEDYGIAGTAGVLVGLLSLITDAGIGRALVLQRERRELLVSQAHSASMLVGLVTSAMMILASIPVARFYGEPRVAPVVCVLSLVLLLSGMNTVPLAMLQQRLDYRKLAAIDFLKAIVQASTVLVGAVFGLRYWSLPLGLIAGQLAAVALTRRFVAVALERPRFSDLRPLLGYSRHLVVGSVAWFAYSNADFAVVGRVAGLSALGFYQFAWNVAQLPGEKLGNVLQSVVGPFFGSIGDDAEKLRHYFLVFSELLVSIMLPVLCGFALVCPIAVPLIFGAKWAQSVPIVQILVLCAAVGSISQLGHHVLGATGRAAFGTKLNLVALLVLPVSFYFAARAGGPLAVAGVWLLVQPVMVVVLLSQMQTTIRLSILQYVKELRAPIVSSAAMTVAVLLTKNVVSGFTPLSQLMAMILTGVVVYPIAYRVGYANRARAIVLAWKSR